MAERPGQGVAVPDMQLFKAPVEALADAPDEIAARRGGGRRIRLVVFLVAAPRLIGCRIRPTAFSRAAIRVTGPGPVKRDLSRQQISDERRDEGAREQVRGQ